ncbi:hypothetical protein VQ042_23405 [Aurantimonas sp. A2-1-M11]|uniref:hypothetical protein n=1 Tax=Aurantimonas sp. A2-1-M11 TaxID=3113712 RepID=UPI002F934FC9
MLGLILSSVGSVGAGASTTAGLPYAVSMSVETDLSGSVDHQHEHDQAPDEGHDHKVFGDANCATHCLTAIPETVVPTGYVPVSRDLSYSVIVTDLTGHSGPTAKRPPRI